MPDIAENLILVVGTNASLRRTGELFPTNNVMRLSAFISDQQCCAAMVSFAIDPELRIRGRPETVLRQSDEALTFLRKKILSLPGGPWQDLLPLFEAIHDEWSALEAVVRLELLLEAEGSLIEGERSGLPSHVNPASLDVASMEN